MTPRYKPKACVDCRTEFVPRSSNGVRCEPCRAVYKTALKRASTRRYYEQHTDEVKARNTAWMAAHPESVARKREGTRDWMERNRERRNAYKRDYAKRTNGHRRGNLSKFGLTLEQYDAMLAAQGGACAICRQSCAVYPNLSVDHCHETGRIRGLLCSACNLALGGFRDDPERLRAATDYVSRVAIVEAC